MRSQGLLRNNLSDYTTVSAKTSPNSTSPRDGYNLKKMRRVTSLLPSWENSSKTVSNNIFDKSWTWSDVKNLPSSTRLYSAGLAAELQLLTESNFSSDSNFSNVTEFENFWPSTLDKESERAARILYSFCKNGSHVDLDQFQDQSFYTTNNCQRSLMIIPRNIIQRAVGLAIFTASRAGLWVSGAGGSGVLISRKDNGEWSSPAGILLQNSRLPFAGGVDIYDCVIIINDRSILKKLSGSRSTIGREMPAFTGPLVEVGSCENEDTLININQPILTYLKSRGFHSNVSLDGTIIVGRVEENKRFYGSRIGATEILSGKAQSSSSEIKLLLETIKFAESRSDINEQALEQLAMETSPSETYMDSSRTSSFGIPEAEDPDPFGVLALERAGLEIRESGSRSRPSSTQFEYHPSPSSPIFARFNRRSIDTQISRSNRGSYVSCRTRTSIDRGTQTMNMATQTDESWTPNTSPTGSDYKRPIHDSSSEYNENDSSKSLFGPAVQLKTCHELQSNTSTHVRRKIKSTDHEAKSDEPRIIDEDDVDNLDLEDEEEPVIFEAASAQATVLQSAKKAGGGLVHIPRRGPPPPIPARSASRGTIDSSTLNALRYQFEKSEICNTHRNSCDDKFLKYSQIIPPNCTTPLPRWHKTFEENKFTRGLPNTPTRT
ncbi:putative duf500 domain-containing protein [Erysiphe necator]|uniref:Putative duf500 domain-containing protein n=1 Tax=Uncinula necator TaxID=52586 RepID=A0A0B1PHN3_UNCNE|nr:putative duf500 domain-containing protein [Erysiphe necator]